MFHLSLSKYRNTEELNLIVHNFVRSIATDHGFRKKKSIKKYKSIFQSYLGITGTVVNTFHLGKNLLKITLTYGTLHKCKPAILQMFS